MIPPLVARLRTRWLSAIVLSTIVSALLAVYSLPVQAETPAPARPAPKLGEHTEALLAEIGYNAAKVKELKDAKVI